MSNLVGGGVVAEFVFSVASKSRRDSVGGRGITTNFLFRGLQKPPLLKTIQTAMVGSCLPYGGRPHPKRQWGTEKERINSSRHDTRPGFVALMTPLANCDFNQNF